MFAVGNKVKVNPSLFEDETIKINHHLFQEAAKHNATGVIVGRDEMRTKGTEYWFRVQFHFFTAPMKEDHMILLTKE